MFKLDNQSFSLNYSILSLPFKKGVRILIPLQYGDYQRSFLTDETLKCGSITMTESSISIAFSRQVFGSRAFSKDWLRPQREIHRGK